MSEKDPTCSYSFEGELCYLRPWHNFKRSILRLLPSMTNNTPSGDYSASSVVRGVRITWHDK